jgi:hypothetical protein
MLYLVRNSKANTTSIKLFRGYDKALDTKERLNRRSKKNEHWVIAEHKIMVY